MDPGRLLQLLEKTNHYDKDERYMAISDLRDLLETTGEIAVELQQVIRDAIVQRLKDQSSDVQAIACNCLGSIVQKFSKDLVVDLICNLGELGTTERNEVKDIYIQGLRTIIKSLPRFYGVLSAQKLSSIMLKGFNDEDSNVDHRLSCLTLLCELLSNYGTEFVDLHDDIAVSLLNSLEHSYADFRKAVGVAIGFLVPVVKESNFIDMVTIIISKTKSMDMSHPYLFTYVQCIGVISRYSGARIDSFLYEIIPLIKQFCKADMDVISEELDELREVCLLACSALIEQCPSMITLYINDVMQLAIRLLALNPNISGLEKTTSQSGGDDQESMEIDDWEEVEGGWGSNDDDDFEGAEESIDETWKVRLAAAKVLRAFIDHKNEILKQYYKNIMKALLSRVEDNERSVREEVFQIICNLISSSVVIQHADDSIKPIFMRKRSFYSDLVDLFSNIMECILSLLNSDDVISRKGALMIFNASYSTIPNEVSKGLNEVFQYILLILESTDPMLVVLALQSFSLILDASLQNNDSFVSVQLFKPYEERLITSLIALVEMESLEIRTSCLGLMTRYILFLRLPDQVVNPDTLKLTCCLYEKLYSLAKINDIEHTVKKLSLLSLSQIIALFGDILVQEARLTIDLILLRLQNPVSQSYGLKSIIIIAKSWVFIDVKDKILEVFSKTLDILKLNNGINKNEVSKAVESILEKYGNMFSEEYLNLAMTHSIALCGSSNVQNVILGLNLVNKILSMHVNVSTNVQTRILDTLLDIASLGLQGEGLNLLISIFPQLLNSSGVSYEYLVVRLKGCCKENMSEYSLRTVARSISALIRVDKDQYSINVSSYQAGIYDIDSLTVALSLAVLGQVGFHESLASLGVYDKTLELLSSSNEMVKGAASYLLGSLCCGDIDFFLPLLCTAIVKETVSGRLFLLLNSLKVLYSSIELQTLKPYITSHLSSILFINAKSDDEGIRDIVSECIGKSCAIDNNVLLELLKLCESSIVFCREVAARSIRFAVSMSYVNQDFSGLFSLLGDDEIVKNVCRQALISLDSLAANHLPFLDRFVNVVELIPLVYEQTNVRADLIHIEDYGGFKEEIDDHLPVRKAAFRCLYTLLKAYYTRIEVPKFLGNIISGTTDLDDVPILTYSMIQYIAQHYPQDLLQILDSLVDIIKVGVKKNLQAAKSVDPSAHLNLEAYLHASIVINNIPTIETCILFQQFNRQVLNTKLLVQMLEAINRGSSS